ncbi:MAG: hypothetical protein M1837_005594 [Sclerophora amabilis]|nr:MAG: hypothetical protein M1837_005594 [Sclerophora amabilis]
MSLYSSDVDDHVASISTASADFKNRSLGWGLSAPSRKSVCAHWPSPTVTGFRVGTTTGAGWLEELMPRIQSFPPIAAIWDNTACSLPCSVKYEASSKDTLSSAGGSDMDGNDGWDTSSLTLRG